MLINKIRKTYRDMIHSTEAMQPIVSIPELRPAANASNFSQPEMQASRLRRQRRLARTGQHLSGGWRVRTW